MNRNPRFQLILIVIAITWLFAVTVSYYIVHKPFTGENAFALLNAFGDVAVATMLYALASALGRRVLRAVVFDSALEEIVIHAGLGLGIVAFATFALGIVGLLNPLAFWIALLIGLALLRRDLVATGRAVRSLDLSRATRLEKWLARFCAFALAVAFMFALMPPTGWDGIQYHLVGPQLALAQGRIAPPPDNLSLSNPALIEMLFLAAMTLKGDSAAQLMHWGYAPLVVGALLIFARRYWTIRAGWLAAALLLAVPSFLRTATWAYNDVALAFYATVALYLTLDARDTGARKNFALAGIFAGLAMGEKYTAVFVALALGALIARPNRRAWLDASAFALSASIVAAPWFIRNWIFVGNPVYPFVWGGAYWDSFRAAWYSRFGTGMLNEPWRLLTVPWEATVLGREDTSLFQATIGPLLLALIPLGALAPRGESTNPRAVRAVWWFVVVLFGVWLIGVAQSKLLWQTRLLFPAFPAFALLAGDAFERLARLQLAQFSAQRFVTLVIGLTLALTALSFTLALAGDPPFAYLAGFESRRAYLTRALGSYYTTAEFVNAHLPAHARVLFLWETRPYYFRRAVTEDAILDRWAHLRFQFRDAQAIARELRRAGYTHVLLHRAGINEMLQSEYDPVSRDDVRVLQELTRGWTQLYGTAPLDLVTREGKLALVDAEQQPYALYALDGGE